MDNSEPPIGRRVAQWRVRRRMTQQMLADRLGKSKSWVDKVERGVRALDRFSVIQDVAEVLRVDAALLLGGDVRRAGTVGTEGVQGVRAALACHDVRAAGPEVWPVGSTGELHRRVEHAWLTYQHAHYPQLMRLVPALLVDASSAHAAGGAGDVAGRIAPSVPHGALPQDLAVCGTLLVEAALAAATCADHRSVAELLDRAAEIAERVDGGQDHHHTGFGAAAVRVARVAAAVELGDGGEAIAQHAQTVRLHGWRRLPVEHRAAYLVDVARAYLQVGDLLGAGRALVEADRTAPAEVRVRPSARTVIAARWPGAARHRPASRTWPRRSA
ncbi:helix-turn-helix domain-containing protein [Micromonospora carbonacea]|uniref:helix-turn-helix domain-containing protein n=1 Tax=Micromonospora carbonacea TaxID=47853 RepID=UPI003719C13A